MPETVAVISTYQTPFKIRDLKYTFVEQAQIAAVGALQRARMSAADIDAIVFSLAPTSFIGVADADRWSVDYIFGSGKPMLRVHTGGATGGSAVHAAYALVRSGMYRTVLVAGAERIAETPDAQKLLNQIFDVFYEKDMALQTITTAALMASRYMHRYGASEEDFARVVVRQRRNALRNPHAHLKGDITIEDVMASPMVAYPLKLYDICPRSSGSAAMILSAFEVAREHCPRPAFVNGVGSVSSTVWIGDRAVPTADAEFSDLGEATIAGRQAFARAGIGDPVREIQVAELYDPFSNIGYAELESLGFCARGTAFRLEREGAWEMDGQVAVCPSGGTLCTNPIAVTGLVRAIEAANQVMGMAGEIQVKNVRNALSTAAGGDGQFVNCTVFGADYLRR